MTGPLRQRVRARLARLAGRPLTRVTATGSRSLSELGPSGPLVLVRSGTLDRERRLFTRVRAADHAALLARPGSVVVIMIRELVGQPIVVPAADLLAHVPAGTSDIPLHVRVGRDGAIVHCETGRDLTPCLGWAHLDRLVATWLAAGGTPTALPRRTHHEWQAIVAAIGRRRGYDVFLPSADRSRVCPHLVRGAGGAAQLGLGSMDVLPAAVIELARLPFVDVVLTRPGDEWPTVLVEVEQHGDLHAALMRLADSLAALRALGAVPLPRCAIVADGRRQAEFVAKRGAPLHAGSGGLAERCRFVSFAQVHAAY